MPAPRLQPDVGEQLLEPGLVRLLAGDRERQDDVLLGGEHRQEVEELEHESDVAAAKPRQLVVAHARNVLTGDLHVSLSRAVEPGEDVQQRRLP
jgi:hypothetical protein